MNNSERELVELVTKFKDEIKNIALDYERAIAKLDSIRKDFDESLERRFFRWATLLGPWILIGCAFLYVSLQDCVLVKTKWFEINRPCQSAGRACDQNSVVNGQQTSKQPSQ